MTALPAAPAALPPSPSLSSLSQTLAFFRDPLALSDRAQRERGDLFTLRLLGLGDWVFACAPEAIEAIFRAPPDVLVAGEPNRRAFASLTGEDSSFALDGVAHRARRRLLQPLFSERAALDLTDTIRARAEAAMDSWPQGAPFALLPRVHALLLDLLVDHLFGLGEAERCQRVRTHLERLVLDGIASPLLLAPPLQWDLGPWSPWGRVRRLHAATLDALSEEIERRRAEPRAGRTDVLSRLLDADDGAGPLPTTAIRDELLQLLFAGHETCGLIFAWTMERLLSHPDKLAALLREVEEVTGGAPVQREHVPRLAYVSAAVNESMRVRGISPMAGVRLVKQPFVLRGYTLPPGTTVVLGLRGLGRHPELFPDPDLFRPERFLERSFAPSEWTIFGGGARQCPGRSLGLVQLKVLLATLLRRARFSLVDAPVRATRRGFFLAPAGGPSVRMERSP